MSQLTDQEDVRLAIYRGFATTGHAPDRDELAAALGLSSDAVHAALRELAQARHVVLDEDGVLVMAHPFAAIPLGFAVMGKAGLWWGGCAWDPSRSRTCCRTSPRCSCRRLVPVADERSLGSSAVTAPQGEGRWRTSWYPSRASGTTW